MKLFSKNVGRHDAQSREVAALVLAVGGVTALPEVHHVIAWLVWLLGLAMLALGARYIRLAVKGCGTWLFGVILIAFAPACVALASTGAGVAAFGIALVLAAVGWITAVAGRCPVNALLGLDTRDGARTASGITELHLAKH